MKCESCKRDALVVVEYTGVGFCSSCYEKVLFRRLKKWLRANNAIREGEVHVLFDDGSLGFLFLQKFFKKFFSYPGFKWVVRKRLTSRVKGVILLPTTLTQESDSFLHAALNNEDYSSGIHSSNVFKPLIVFLESDLLKWKRFSKGKVSFKDEHAFLEEVGKRRPMARFSMLNQLEQF